MRKLIAVLIALLAAPLVAQQPEVWSVDKSHSVAAFEIRHLMSIVTGNFRDFSADITIDRANPEKSSIELTIQAKSIDTGTARRDDHLRSHEFFDVEKFPTITFRSTQIRAKSGTEFEITGDLTMHGVTRRVTLPVAFLGFGKDGNGTMRCGFAMTSAISRKDFGIAWNRDIPGGGLVLGDEVKVAFHFEAMQKK